MGKYQLCQPSAVGAGTGALVGLVVWALVSFVPAFHSGVPQPVVAVLPFALGWLGHVAAAWAVPHPAPPAAPAASALPARSGGSAGVTGAVTGSR